jgi:hypothetical protein
MCMYCLYAYVFTGGTTNETTTSSSVLTSSRDFDSSTVYSMSSLQHLLQTVSESVASHQYTASSIMIDTTDNSTRPLEQQSSQLKAEPTGFTAAESQPVYPLHTKSTSALQTGTAAGGIDATELMKSTATLSSKAVQQAVDTSPNSKTATGDNSDKKSNPTATVDDSNDGSDSDCSSTACDSMDSVDDIIGFYSRATSMLMYHIMPNISSTASPSNSNAKQKTIRHAVMIQLRDTLTQLDSIDKSFTEVKHSSTDQLSESSLEEHCSKVKYQLFIVGAKGYDKSDVCNTLCGGIKVSYVTLYSQYAIPLL